MRKTPNNQILSKKTSPKKPNN